ncbi:hypothetical protein DRQ27_00190 [bacterium]|nr:MAG: hypothetical protein DRQ27_00190 [bacterium]
MRKFLLITMPLLALCLASAQTIDLATATQALDKGVKSYLAGDMDKAKPLFEEAIKDFEQLLGGVLSPSDEAYSKYFLATARYYAAKIGKDRDLIEKAAETFRDAALAFKNLGIIGEEYVRSVYMRSLCSFRLFQLAATERAQARELDKAIGNLMAFLDDENVQKNKADFQDLIDNATYLLGYCQYQLGYINSFYPGKYGTAKKFLKDAVETFKKAKMSSNEQLALSAAYMEATCHYVIARLYLRVPEDKWEKYKLAKGTRFSAAEEELGLSMKILGKMVVSAGTYKDLQLMGKIGKLIDMITLGSVGDKKQLDDALEKLTDLRSAPGWGDEVLNRIADGALLNYLIYNGPLRSAASNLSRVASKNFEAYYWAGWLHFINSEYDKANAKFSTFLSKSGAIRTTKMRELRADAKFRQAECLFWMGVKRSDINLLGQADNIYKALENPKGEYYRYLTEDARDVVAIRRFLINIESSLGKERNVSVFDAAMALAGLQLPKDAEKYIDAGKYFLQKGIETAALERETALRFAIHAFDKVLSAGVSSALKNRARFLKGVALVKLATVQEKDKAPATIEEARGVLEGCTSPFRDEAKYVIGIGYFNINKYDLALSLLSPLKAKGHYRAAFTYAIIKEEQNRCADAARALGSILKTIRNKTDYWYQKADLELSKLPCRAQASAASALPRYKEAPMTYERLVDEEAERARKKHECLYIWHKDSRYKEIPDIDKLIPDRPPETHVTIELAIEPKGGEETIIFDGKPDVAKPVSGKPSLYKITTNRGTHEVVVKKKGFYKWDGKIKITRSERITITLKKAVKYTPTGEVSGTRYAIAVSSNGSETFVANAKDHKIIWLSKDGSKKGEFRYSDLTIGGVGGLALDGRKLIITDPKRNQIIRLIPGKSEVIKEEPEESTAAEGEEAAEEAKPVKAAKLKFDVIAYSGERYGSSPLWMPAGVAVSEGVYYIADAGNHRIVVFEGKSFKKEFGRDELVHPLSVAVNGDEILVADIGKGKIVRFSIGGEYLGDVELPDQKQPAYVYVAPDGFVFVADYATNTLIKYTPKLEPLSIAATGAPAPKAVSQIGEGPASVVYLANLKGLTVLKGSWDNNYKP